MWNKTTEPKLLTRDAFREGVQARDGHKCVFCGETEGLDSHHILERRLFPDGGYYIDNGATVCQQHHLMCERTQLSVEEVREACNITRKLMPPHLYSDTMYDKWGNPILPNGARLKGELFFDESVQKVLDEGGALESFTHWVKYPRTHHVFWSPGVNDDDRVIRDMSAFYDQRVIVTEKMDGENTSLYRDRTHARSLENKSHPSRDWVKQFWSQFANDIPEGWRVCGENLYAKHSIGYEELPAFFMGFSIWNEKNVCLAWDETLEWFELLGITPVPVLFDGLYDEHAIRARCDMKGSQCNTIEGYVIRRADPIGYGEFKTHFAKYVRAGHVQQAKHWFFGQQIEKNGLKK